VDHEKLHRDSTGRKADAQQVSGKVALHVPGADPGEFPLPDEGADEDAAPAVLLVQMAFVAVFQEIPVEIDQALHAADFAQCDEIEILRQDGPGNVGDLVEVLVGIENRRIHRQVFDVGQGCEFHRRIVTVQEHVEILRVEGGYPEDGRHWCLEPHSAIRPFHRCRAL
jgi:hypothetical protein